MIFAAPDIGRSRAASVSRVSDTVTPRTDFADPQALALEVAEALATATGVPRAFSTSLTKNE